VAAREIEKTEISPGLLPNLEHSKHISYIRFLIENQGAPTYSALLDKASTLPNSKSLVASLRQGDLKTALNHPDHELSTMVGAYVFSKKFNAARVKELRQNYVKQITFGESMKPPQKRFMPHAATL
jgi:hypothetical protein